MKKALDSDLKKDTTVDKPTREGIVNEADRAEKGRQDAAKIA